MIDREASGGGGFGADMAGGEGPEAVAIIDDNDSMRASIVHLMNRAGLLARGFASAEAFPSSVERGKTGCVIAAIETPGMSGLELQARLNEDLCGIPVIFVTASLDEKTRMHALRAGAAEFLNKPVDDDVLLDSVRAALNR
jgi:FixJ family two-component response regulator